jgi:ATP-binding cassette subfamily B (MDR/TAP) protein 1
MISDMAKRVFHYADGKSWALNIVAFIAAIAAGTLLPLMNLVFGKFVSTIVGFATGSLTPAQYRSEVNKYTCVILDRVLTMRLTIIRLYFIYLFIGKFATVYIHSVSLLSSRLPLR